MSAAESELDALRIRIDQLDAELLKLLARRMDYATDIGRYKKDHNLTPLDTERWQAVLNSWLGQAETLELPAEFVTKLYDLIHQYALQVETDKA